jgi:hypothetical protein
MNFSDESNNVVCSLFEDYFLRARARARVCVSFTHKEGNDVHHELDGVSHNHTTSNYTHYGTLMLNSQRDS